MKNLYPSVVERSLDITERYLAKWGRAMIGVYRFPIIQDQQKMIFLDSIKTTLERRALLPAYLWVTDVKWNCFYFIIWINGFFRDELNDIDRVIARLWQRQSDQPFSWQETIPVNLNNWMAVRNWLISFLLAIDIPQITNREVSVRKHQRSFGSTRIF